MGSHRADVRDLGGVCLDSPRPVAGRRVADRPVDASSMAASTYVGRRIAKVPEAPPLDTSPQGTLSASPAPAVELDTGTIERVLADLEPADETTSFEHELTEKLPLLRAQPEPEPEPEPAPVRITTPGKRRAVKHSGSRGPLFKGLPSVPVLLGVAALAVSVGGAVTATEPGVVSNDSSPFTAASALNGSSGTGKVQDRSKRRAPIISRDKARDAQEDAAGEDLVDAAEGLVKQRNSRLRELANDAEAQSKIIAQNLWRYPLATVQLTAFFGQYGLWSSYHTGLDFNGSSGEPIMAIANGVVTSASYDGAYGNKTVVTLEDGTEIWYCHQNSFTVSVGDTVRAGEVIGTVGATGHVTGSHLHLEVRPGGGDPVDPHAAMQQHGLF